MENKHWDVFFYGETLDPIEEIETDLLAGFLQPKGSMYFARQDGTLLAEGENHPQSFIQEIMFAADILEYIGRRNLDVATANDGREQRVAASQQTISIDIPERGHYDAEVRYIPFFSAVELKALKVSI